MNDPWSTSGKHLAPAVAAALAAEWERYWSFSRRPFQGDAGVRLEAASRAAEALRAVPSTLGIGLGDDDVMLYVSGLFSELADGYILMSREWQPDEVEWLSMPRPAEVAGFLERTGLDELCAAAGHPIALGKFTDGESALPSGEIDPAYQARRLWASLWQYTGALEALVSQEGREQVYAVRSKTVEYACLELNAARRDRRYLVGVQGGVSRDPTLIAAGARAHLAEAWFLLAAAPNPEALPGYVLHDAATLGTYMDEFGLTEWMAARLEADKSG